MLTVAPYIYVHACESDKIIVYFSKLQGYSNVEHMARMHAHHIPIRLFIPPTECAHTQAGGMLAHEKQI